ncbi:MAG: DegT/DnrJ/EryC1/StrS family aminotransferase [Planctomycetes bacterium]|nr:DegT/DnrJ/EryC1/StrS family aminotransferase [Planctomycetota bacterium]
MSAFLFALGNCGDAPEVAAAVRAVRAGGAAAALAWHGDAARLRDAVAAGLPTPDHERSPSASASPPQFAADAAAFAATLLATPWRAVVTIGHDAFAQAIGAAAASAGLAVVRIGAGVRSHVAGCRRDAARRRADHAATLWLCDGEAQRQELVREGADPAQAVVTGNLLADAASTVAASDEAVIAWEHAESFSSPDAARQRLERLAAALAPRRVTVLATPWLARTLADARLPAGVALAPSNAAAALRAALGAAVLVTDSVGFQRHAQARGIRCVVDACHGPLADAVATGCVHVASDATGGLVAAVRRALAAPAPVAAPQGAASRFAAQLTAVTIPMAPTATPVVALPSDGDASGRTLGAEEALLAADAIRRGTLNSTRGRYVGLFEQRFAQWLGRKHAIACASGSAAMHCAIAALRLQPGDEVVTTPITDMGALTPILYEGGVPVFADVDPDTLNITPATVAAQLTPRTRAIVVTHLFGRPADVDGLAALARERGLPLIEDAAQAFGARWRGRRCGTFGALAAFSLQQGKHITTGEGGIVATDDDELARRVFLYVNKAWGYGDKKPDHYFPALNYRMTELQGAVAVAQLPKLDDVVAARRAVCARLAAELADVPGLALPGDPSDGAHSWWKFAFRVDADVVPGGALALGQRMQQAGVACVPRYVQKPAFECELFTDWSKSPVTWLPLQHNPRRTGPMPPFVRADYPGAVRGLEQVIVLPINEHYRERHVQHVAATIRAAVGAMQHA